MNRKYILIPGLSLFLAIGNIANAQDNSSKQLLEREPQTAAEINKLVPEDTYALPWERIAEENILWKKRVWREIDINEPGNESFRHKKDAPDFTNMLIGGITTGKFKAYDAADSGRFTKALSPDEFTGLLSNNGMNNFSPDKVSGYKFKEDWLFLEKEHKVVVRIAGIAPLVKITNTDGTSGDKELFWLYYPEMRNFLARQPANTGDAMKKMNWDELFESRNFKTKIYKISDRTNWRNQSK